MFGKYIVPLVGKKKRKGRGIGSGSGKTCGRGTKGQKARKSGKTRPGFEGGQTPVYIRTPKTGFYRKKKKFSIVNISKFGSDDSLSSHSFDFSGQEKVKVKVLARGDITRKISVKAHSFSKSAKKKILAKGGETIVI